MGVLCQIRGWYIESIRAPSYFTYFNNLAQTCCAMGQKYIYINSQVYINKHETDKKTE